MWRALSATSWRDERLGLGVGDGRHAGGEEVDPRAHPVGVAGEDLAQALALGEDLAELGDVLEGHGGVYFRKRALTVVA